MENWKIVFTLFLQLWFMDVTTGWLFSSDNCYRRPNIGCFSNTGYFSNTMGFTPQGPRQQYIRFLYKGLDQDTIFTLEQTQQRIRDVYNPSHKTVVIIHGYLENARRPWITSMVNALNTRRPLNIFVVDWSEGAGNILNYFQCVANSRVTGAVIGLFLNELIGLGASPSNMHVIGFSLGAQVAGYVGERVPGLGRITGLDPAGPGFLNTHPSVHLDPTDAAVVDVVHTDRDMGTLEPYGTFDFYPNGGADQPSCGVGAMSRITSFVSQMDFSRSSLTRTVGCSHIRAAELFTSSIRNRCNYVMTKSSNLMDMSRNQGTQCQDGACPTFGFDLDVSRTSNSGIYRFPTSGHRPYC